MYCTVTVKLAEPTFPRVSVEMGASDLLVRIGWVRFVARRRAPRLCHLSDGLRILDMSCPRHDEQEVDGRGNALASRLERLCQSGVTFAACQNTMRRMHIGRDALLPFVVPVDSGVAEVVRKQADGWVCLKAGS